jgi:hypothetical protein
VKQAMQRQGSDAPVSPALAIESPSPPPPSLVVQYRLKMWLRCPAEHQPQSPTNAMHSPPPLRRAVFCKNFLFFVKISIFLARRKRAALQRARSSPFKLRHTVCGWSD